MKCTMIFFASIVLLVSKAHSADCTNMQLQANQTAFDMATNPTVNTGLVVKANTMPGGCDFFITFDYGQGNSYNNRGLRMWGNSSPWPFQLSKDAASTNILKNIPDVTSMNDVLYGTLEYGSNDRQVNVNYWAILNMSNPWLPWGNYTDTFTLNLYRGNPFGVYNYVDTKIITFNYYAAKRVDISVVSSGGTFNLNDTSETMNFGNLTSGATKTADVILKYNAGYILYASSANNGQMKHQSLSQYISYAIKFNGTTYSLAGSSTSPTQIQRDTGRSPASGLTIPVSVTAGSIAGKQSGIYSDVITLTVQSAE